MSRRVKGEPLSGAPDAARVKRRALELGADLAGIASAATLNAFPPDPRFPQTPERISPHVRSVVVIAQRIPAGAFRCKQSVPVQYLDMLALRRMDRIGARLAGELEACGHPSFVLGAQETHWDMKRASYGSLSTRHLGVEAGLGTLGLEVNILTPEFGPRLYLTGVLTEAGLEADTRMTEQVCIGESCSRCLHACPSDAVRHFGIDKPACATAAQEFGYAQITRFFGEFLTLSAEGRGAALASRDLFGFWQGLLRVVGSFGDCPRCLAVCPVGNDYHAHLADVQKSIPEKTAPKAERVKELKSARAQWEAGQGEVAGLNDWNLRWVGEDGYTGIVARQMQEFKRAQRERAEQAKPRGES